MAKDNKTHPMLLIAAVALTLFSVLGSAVIAGLIPYTHSQQQQIVPAMTDGTGATIANSENIASNHISIKGQRRMELVGNSNPGGQPGKH